MVPPSRRRLMDFNRASLSSIKRENTWNTWHRIENRIFFFLKVRARIWINETKF